MLNVASETSTSGGISPSTVLGASSWIDLVASVLCMCLLLLVPVGEGGIVSRMFV